VENHKYKSFELLEQYAMQNFRLLCFHLSKETFCLAKQYVMRILLDSVVLLFQSVNPRSLLEMEEKEDLQ
jgi:hypothetical protein